MNFVIYEEDYLSHLADDCLLDIFTRLDMNDLDEVATLSSKLCSLSAVARPKAVKLQASNLTITQEKSFLRFEMRYNYQTYFLGNSDKLESQITRPPQHPITDGKTMSDSVRNRAAIFYERFAFKQVELERVSMDDHFVEFIEQITSKTCASLCVNNCSFNANSSYRGRHRFMTIIRSVMPGEFTLRLKTPAISIDQDFLIEYANRIEFPYIMIDIENSSILHADDLFMASLWKFKILDMPNLLVNSDLLIDALFTRLRCRRTGCWKFAVSRNIDEREFTSALGHDLKCTRDDRSGTTIFRIDVIGTARVYFARIVGDMPAAKIVGAISDYIRGDSAAPLDNLAGLQKVFGD
ncbi:hypothetical protein PRIPAC_84206 [Pristionchus pacificus]|uniref:Uncharacterized protein n=1 Tax=Pristionchus pacificus TaxID=54126 RepID=A0A2A6BMK2_PRIPA|nr:hypothetical protein PRIPAC_84206 [Pristionchus pacificus]|eukprot:PDM67154.1 hypothetical protein PRIPAC_48571 [Pristionchus pacificus]